MIVSRTSWAALVAASHLVSGAGRRFSTVIAGWVADAHERGTAPGRALTLRDRRGSWTPRRVWGRPRGHRRRGNRERARRRFTGRSTMAHVHPAHLRTGRGVLAAVLALGMLLLGLAAPAAADTRPPAGAPATVTADALPTVQVNGVVWAMTTVGRTVYATGSFTRARPAGAAPGVSETPRGNLVAFDLVTGVMTSFN